jgi:predicted dehydrogenase
MVLWNDLLPTQRVSVFDAGIEVEKADVTAGERRRREVSYRIGNMVAPALEETEALRSVLKDWAGAIRDERAPETDGPAGLRVLRVLEAADASLRAGSRPVDLRPELVA